MMDDQRKNAWTALRARWRAVLAASKGKGRRRAGRVGYPGGAGAELPQFFAATMSGRPIVTLPISGAHSSIPAHDGRFRGTAAAFHLALRYRRGARVTCTHPVTVERIADARSRSASSEFKRWPAKASISTVIAPCCSYVGEPKTAVAFFESALEDRKFASEAATRYGLAAAALLRPRFRACQARALHHGCPRASPMIAAMLGQVLVQNEAHPCGGSPLQERAIAEFPNHWQLHYDPPEVLLRAKEPKRAWHRWRKVSPSGPTTCNCSNWRRGRPPKRARCDNIASLASSMPGRASARRDRTVRAGIEGRRWRLLRSELRRTRARELKREMQWRRRDERRSLSNDFSL